MSFCNKCGNSCSQSSNQNPVVYQNQGYNNYQNTGYNVQKQPGEGKAVAAIICGAVAFMMPIPVLDVIAGIIGVILAIVAGNEGCNSGTRTAGLIISIVGILSALLFNIYVFFIGAGVLSFLSAF